jgi:hypothetical protein
MEPHTLENPCRSTPSKSEGHRGHGVKTGAVPTLAGRAAAGPPKDAATLFSRWPRVIRKVSGPPSQRPIALGHPILGPAPIVRMTRGQAR